MAELIASGDTLDIGRQAINTWYSGTTNIYTASTSNSVRLIGGSNTINAGVAFGFAGGKSNQVTAGSYGIVIGGSANTIQNSFAFIGNGRNNTATNVYSFVGGGQGNTSSGPRSLIVAGKTSTANGPYSTVINGVTNAASGNKAFIGNGTTNTMAGFCGFIGNGLTNTVSSSSSFFPVIVNGTSNIVSGAYNFGTILNGSTNISSNSMATVVNGFTNTASGSYSFIPNGRNNTASHSFGIAIGRGASTDAAYTMVFAATTTPGSNNTIKFDFQNGNGYFDGAADVGNADYAEYFEWADENPNGDDRFGYAVSIEQEGKISIGNKKIIGIISPTPGIVGDSAELSWKLKYKTDEWGRKITKKFKKILSSKLEFPIYIDDNNIQYLEAPTNEADKQKYVCPEPIVLDDELLAKAEEINIPLFHENYDPKSEYIPRSKRKEWAVVGLLGKLKIRTAEKIKNKAIDINSNGLAVNGNSYYIIRQIKEFDGNYGIIEIFFK